MLTLLGLLIASYIQLNVNRTSVSPVEYWSVDIPFGLYLGWIAVATVANIADWLYLVEWNGFGIPAQTWAIIMLAVASLLGLAMALMRRDAAYLVVLVWAFIGIAVKQVSAPMVVLSSWIAAVIIVGLVIFSLPRRQLAQSKI